MKARPLPSSSHPSRPPPLLAALLLLAAVASGARASPAGLGVDVDEGPSAGAGGGGEAPAPDVHPALYEVRWADALLWGVMSWNVMVVVSPCAEIVGSFLARPEPSYGRAGADPSFTMQLFAFRTLVDRWFHHGKRRGWNLPRACCGLARRCFWPNASLGIRGSLPDDASREQAVQRARRMAKNQWE